MIVWIKSQQYNYVFVLTSAFNLQRKLTFVRKIVLSGRVKKLSTLLLDCKKLFNSTILLVGMGLN